MDVLQNENCSPNTKITLMNNQIPPGSRCFSKRVQNRDVICDWDPFNAVILSEYNGKVKFENIIEI